MAQQEQQSGVRMTGAQAVIASLEAEGVEYLFGYPGAQAIDMFDALYDSPINFVLARHEQGAVHEADGFARATGKAGVVLVTSGPGAANTVCGIATAYMDSIPLVVITAQVPTSAIGTDSFQESDIFGITLPVVKHSYLMRSADELPVAIKKAFHIATTGRPGPVLIDVPSDVAAAQLNFSYPDQVVMPSYKPTVRGNQKQVKQAAALLAEACQPVILAGGGVVSAGAAEELADLAHALQAPVACTIMGKGSFPASDPLNLGALGMHGSAFAGLALREADVVVAVGTRFSDRVTGNPDMFAPKAKLIHIDVDPAEIGKILPVAVPIVGDAKGILADIAQAVRGRIDGPATKEWLAQIDEWRLAHPLPSVRQSSNGAIDARWVLSLLSQRIDQCASIVTTDVGQHQMWANQMVERSVSRSFLSSGGLGTMGFGLPAAIGAALGRPDAHVVCITGDGSLQMNMQEMATAVEVGAPVKVLLLNNGVLGMVRQWQGLFHEQHFSATGFSANPDFCAVAQAFGWQAEHVDSSDQLESALGRMLESDGPFLLDVRIPDDQYVFPMVPPGASAADGIVSAQEAKQLVDAQEKGGAA